MKIKDAFMYILGAVIAVGVFVLIGMLIALMFRNPDSNLKDVLVMSVGALIAAFTMVVSYFYGSSKGSADKQDAIERNMNDNQ